MNRCLPNNMELIGLNFNTLCNRVATGIPVANSCDSHRFCKRIYDRTAGCKIFATTL